MGIRVFIYLYVLSKQSATDMTTYNELVKKWSQQLEIYDPSEAESLIHWLLEHHLGLRRVDMMHFLEEKDLPEALHRDFERLKRGEPIQYILGKAPFYGREFLVNSATLIPRNETEELVHLILKENPQQGLRILDIGTGTGCIPISLSLEMKSPEVFGLDISQEALEVARQNAKLLKAEVKFLQVDILREKIPLENLDILISNPPYIPEKGKTEMHQNVLDFEPGLALFVPDEDPLLFYRRIAALGREHLKKGGKLYFEIHEDFGTETVELLQSMAYQKIRLIQDLNGKNRMVAAVWEG
ncbi:peptide chain release factor N(5)-glutamine methyltransferase [Algoriphagus sp. CAU 1675]|uniref:peptide chain release factor N(5)-glutamine methyltransferase n=1 Tax=Algoriphagus sp. CAU 1675 TaxID=3032597 RepID=UPI0023D9B7D7|nr:peptide chain release factor N(5)-glutamine methyltransferase [Algoriphagus sp. CAU 1675]MDF2156462.1 peptide chain release factor N(5)-glutamine methyltransferase [Algoriphagus sp. CAU 1675]